MVGNRWDRWREALRGAVIEPDDERFRGATAGWSPEVVQRPSAVVVAADVEDISSALALAARDGRTVAVQATGHGATGRVDGAVLLHTSALSGVTVDPRARTASLGPGALVRDVQAAAAAHGLSAVVAAVPGIGMTGYVLGGGLGVFARRHGLAARSVRSAEIVTGGGEHLHVDPGHEPDLLWALRGGGAPPGVVTRLEIDLIPVRDVAAGTLTWSADHSSALWEAFRAWTSDLPDDLTSTMGAHQLPPLPAVPEPVRGKRVVVLTVCLVGGDESGLRSLLRPLTAVAEPLLDTVRARTPDDLDLAGLPPGPVPTRTRSEFLDTLPADLDAVLDLGDPTSSPLMAIELRHLGGALSRSSDGPAATGGILAPYMFEYVALVPDPVLLPALGAEQDRLLGALGHTVTGRALRGFATGGDSAPERFFDAATRDRLADVARRYDPHGVLHDPLRA